MRSAIINVSTKKFWPGQKRLISTLQGKTTADLLMYQHEHEVGAPLHRNNSHGFKTAAMMKAKYAGYDLILWLDASMYVIKDLSPIFDQVERDGYFFQDSGWENERWTNESQRKYFGTNKGEMISSGVVGINVNHPEGMKFLELWHKAMLDGMFNGSLQDSRQDQTCASLIIYKMGLKITENNEIWSYGKADEVYRDNILLVADGIC